MPRRLLPLSMFAALVLSLSACGADAGTPAGNPGSGDQGTPADQLEQMTPAG